MTGANLLFEIQSGAHERMLVTPASRSSLMVGRALKEMVPLVVQALVITAVAAVFGFRPSAGGMLWDWRCSRCSGWLRGLSYALAIASRERDWMFWGVQQGCSSRSSCSPGCSCPGERPALDAGDGRLQPADPPRRRRARAVQRLVRHGRLAGSPGYGVTVVVGLTVASEPCGTASELG
jgi:hypothetical protein